MQGVSPTAYGNYVLREAGKSQSYASMQLGMFRHELSDHQSSGEHPCKAFCAGCAELTRVINGLEPLAHPLTHERERYP